MINSISNSPGYRRVRLVCIGVAAILVIGWPISIIINWADIVNSDARLGYFIGDLGLVSPLLIVSWLTLKKSEPKGSMLFLVAAGALSYDALHFGIFLIKIKFLSVSPVLYALLIAVILFIILLLVKDRIKYLLTITQ
ncbi:hypothetical protein QWZ08_19550 [Ferruginibacter paludis]|uniref:hypothetical protein n=1 Tax=Ferruginibacter paludis TaxID=1310417 RepID=UPI0025B5BD19|nr:hypothetical protein [Ferruginibacter paludis]MDN3657857.1 hypothetical protein [Ferruginibacter paludis]